MICTPSFKWPRDHKNYFNYCKYQLLKWNSEEIGEVPENCTDEPKYWIEKWDKFMKEN